MEDAWPSSVPPLTNTLEKCCSKRKHVFLVAEEAGALTRDSRPSPKKARLTHAPPFSFENETNQI